MKNDVLNRLSEPTQGKPDGRTLEGMIELIDGFYSEILANRSYPRG